MASLMARLQTSAMSAPQNPSVNLASSTTSTSWSAHIAGDTVPIQLAQYRFPGLAIRNAQI